MLRAASFGCALFFATLRCASSAAAQEADPAAALAAQAAQARATGDLAGAATLYTQALAANPHWIQGWWLLGNLQYQQNQYAAAVESLSQYIADAPKTVTALALRGLCEFELQRYPASLADIEQALSLGAANEPRNAQILLYHDALLLTLLGRFDEAIAKYSDFAKQGILNDDVALGLGLAGLRIAQLPAAVPPAEAQLALASGRAALQILSGNVTAGRQAFEQLDAAFPTQANLHYFCGYLLLSTDPDLGAQEFRREIAVVPGSQPAHTMLAWTLEMQGDFAAALPVAREAMAENATLPTNQLVLGRALLETDDAKAALPPLTAVAAAQADNLEAHLALTKAYAELGQPGEARQQRLLSLQLAGDKGAAHAP